MKKKSWKTALLIKTLILMIGLTWGFSIGKYKFFPHDVLLSIKNSMSSGNSEYEPQSWKFKVEHFSSLNADFDYCMLGDSITDYAEWSELLPDYKIANRGISGDTTGGVLKRLDQVISKKPKAVYIMLGVNDVRLKYSVDEIKGNYKKIIEQLRQASIKVTIVSTVHVRLDNDHSKNHKISLLNDFLKDYSSHESEVSFIDLNQTLSENNRLKEIYSKDGLHLKASAYTIWAKHIEASLKLL